MSNMSYVRFRNTLADLQDCYENIEDHPTTEYEERARAALVRLCKKIAEEWGDEFDKEDEDKVQAQA